MKTLLNTAAADIPGKAVPKFWDMLNLSDNAAEIHIYGDILPKKPYNRWTGEQEKGLYVAPEDFLKDLEKIRNKTSVTIRINSGGGDLFTGVAIHNLLKELKAEKTVIVEGLAASAASLIMLAGDIIKVYPGSLVMIHQAVIGLQGFFAQSDLQKVLNQIKKCNEAVLNMYHDKTGIDKNELVSLMEQETWMTGKDAVEKGFANELLSNEGNKTEGTGLSANGKVLTVAGIMHSTEGFYNIPESIPVSDSINPAVKVGKDRENTALSSKEEPIIMDLKELRAQYPDIIKDIENTASENAVKAERERLQAIDAIESEVGDKALINEAKFGDSPMTAEQVALKALTRQKELGTKHLKDVKDDYEASNAAKIDAVPNGGAVKQDNTAAEIRNLADTVNGLKGGRK